MASTVEVKLDPEQIQRVNTILYSMPGKAKTVFSAAIKRGLESGRKQAEQEIKERYDITTANMRTYKTVKLKSPRMQGDEVVGEILFSGAKIPLYRFHPSPKYRKYTNEYVNGYGGWRKTSPVKASDVKGVWKNLTKGFIATFQSGHTGIFYRTGDTTGTGKDELAEYWGFSIEDMLDYEPARENITDKMSETVEKRVEQELYRVLNGF